MSLTSLKQNHQEHSSFPRKLIKIDCKQITWSDFYFQFVLREVTLRYTWQSELSRTTPYTHDYQSELRFRIRTISIERLGYDWTEIKMGENKSRNCTTLFTGTKSILVWCENIDQILPNHAIQNWCYMLIQRTQCHVLYSCCNNMTV